jgi:hypothetical protein
VRLSPGDASCDTARAQLYYAQFYRTHSVGRNVLTVVICKVHHTQRVFLNCGADRRRADDIVAALRPLKISVWQCSAVKICLCQPNSSVKFCH